MSILGVRLSSLQKHFCFVAIATFLFINIALRHTGGGNAASRYALSMGMVTENTFAIDGYESITADWSQTPDGRFYSNKPPGPSLFGYPVAWLIDRIFIDQDGSKTELFARRMSIWANSLAVQAFFIQVIPCVFLLLLMDRLLVRWRLSKNARGLALIGIVFGCTPSFLQNTMFGHGMAASAMLASVLFVYERRLAWSGACFGIALLADYGAAFLLPGLLYIWWSAEGRFWEKFRSVAVGAAVPALLWVWYHTVSFGSPFITSHKYLAPIWVDVPPEKDLLWGIFSSAPDPWVAVKLLFGRSRGLLFTQPWVLVALAAGVALYPKLKKLGAPVQDLAVITYSGFLGLWVANSSFNGWHGGDTVGPRYLSVGLYLFPVWAALVYDAASPWIRKSLIFSMAFAVFYFACAFPQGITFDQDPWVNLWRDYAARSYGMKLKIAVFFALIMWCGCQYLNQDRVQKL